MTTSSTTAAPAAARARNVPALTGIGIGLVLTSTVAVLPALGGAPFDALVAHVQAGYPAYSLQDAENAAGLYVAILASVGAVGALAWLGTLWAVLARQGWARWLALGLLAASLLLALVGLTTLDTSGDVGLAPVIGWLQLVPCLAGAAVVFALWRRSAASPTRR